jgi:hypothetical protein
MTLLWWAGERTSEPPLVELLSTENRGVSISIVDALNEGESVLGTPTVEVVNWRTEVPYPLALEGSPIYNSGTKVVTQKILASELPLREHVAMRVSFVANYAGGTDVRSAVIALFVTL